MSGNIDANPLEKHPFERSQEGLRKLLYDVDRPVETPYWMKPITEGFSAIFWKWADKQARPDTNLDEYTESPKSSPASLVYRHETRGRISHPWTMPNSEWIVELARFTVPYNSQAIIRSIEQYVGIYNLQGTIDSIIDPENPFADADAGIEGEWLFRLDFFTGLSSPWINQQNPFNLLPGRVLDDMPSTQNVWFPVGSSRFHHILIPGKSVLRCFWHCRAPQVRPAVALAISGGSQTVHDETAKKGVKIW